MKYALSPSELAELCKKKLPAVSMHFRDRTIPMGGKRAGINPGDIKEFLKKRGADYSFKVISHLNLKGGCGKTTAAVNLATRAKQYGHNVCILDLDSQASATLTFNILARPDQPVFVDVFEDPKSVKQALIEIEPSLSILPSSLNNGVLDSYFSSKPKLIKTAVKNICAELKNMGFTLVVIDCSPALSGSVISTICASDMIIVPVGSDVYSKRGLELTVEEVKNICDTFHLPIPKIKILFSKYDGREKISLDALTDITQDKAFSKFMLQCFIRTCSELPKAAKNGETVFANFKKSTAREDYDMYARTILGLDKIKEI